MLKPLVLSLWLLTFILALFALTVDVWEGAAPWYFVGAVILGLVGPSGTWVISKWHPETDRAAWVCIGLTGGAIGIAALLRLVVLLWA